MPSLEVDFGEGIAVYYVYSDAHGDFDFEFEDVNDYPFLDWKA
jgi:hypothetical protein